MKKRILFLTCLCLSMCYAGAQDLHVVFIGNSITQGVQLKDAKTEAPPAQAALFLQEQVKGTVEFRNCGRSGRTTLNFLPVTDTEFPKVLAAADETEVLAPAYHRGCYAVRNDFLVDHAQILVAWYDGSKGGTRYTWEYACRRGVERVNLWRDPQGTLF